MYLKILNQLEGDVLLKILLDQINMNLLLTILYLLEKKLRK